MPDPEPTTASRALVPAAYVVLVRDGRVLLQRRANTGFYDGFWAMAAAGHVEQGESCTAAAIREAREELSLELTGDALRPLCVMHRIQPTGLLVDQRVDFFFTASTWRGDPRLAEPQRTDRLEWFALGELPDRVVPHERVVLDGLRAGTLPTLLTFGF